MQIFQINEQTLPMIAKLMSTAKPEWWDYDGALGQLSAPGTIGWYLAESREKPQGWLLCNNLQLYRCLELECMGYVENGSLVMGVQLQPLYEEAESWAGKSGYAVLRYTISSNGMSCHGRALGAYWEELRYLMPIAKPQFVWLQSTGYVPTGFMPNIYGHNHHGILMVKEL